MPNVRDHDASVYLRLQGDALSVGGYEANPIFWEEVRHGQSEGGQHGEPTSSGCPEKRQAPQPHRVRPIFLQTLKDPVHGPMQIWGRWRAFLKASAVGGSEIQNNGFRRSRRHLSPVSVSQ